MIFELWSEGFGLGFRVWRGVVVVGFRVFEAMDGSGPDWKGLLKWSIAHSDGTQAPRDLRYENSLFLCDLEGFASIVIEPFHHSFSKNLRVWGSMNFQNPKIHQAPNR